jgi:hypothetical protein
MTELEALKAKLKKREDKPGWKASVEAIKKRIAELEA